MNIFGSTPIEWAQVLVPAFIAIVVVWVGHLATMSRQRTTLAEAGRHRDDDRQERELQREKEAAEQRTKAFVDWRRDQLFDATSIGLAELAQLDVTIDLLSLVENRIWHLRDHRLRLINSGEDAPEETWLTGAARRSAVRELSDLEADRKSLREKVLTSYKAIERKVHQLDLLDADVTSHVLADAAMAARQTLKTTYSDLLKDGADEAIGRRLDGWKSSYRETPGAILAARNELKAETGRSS